MKKLSHLGVKNGKSGIQILKIEHKIQRIDLARVNAKSLLCTRFFIEKRLLTNNENYEEKFVVFVYARLFCDCVYGM